SDSSIVSGASASPASSVAVAMLSSFVSRPGERGTSGQSASSKVNDTSPEPSTAAGANAAVRLALPKETAAVLPSRPRGSSTGTGGTRPQPARATVPTAASSAALIAPARPAAGWVVAGRGRVCMLASSCCPLAHGARPPGRRPVVVARHGQVIARLLPGGARRPTPGPRRRPRDARPAALKVRRRTPGPPSLGGDVRERRLGHRGGRRRGEGHGRGLGERRAAELHDRRAAGGGGAGVSGARARRAQAPGPAPPAQPRDREP